MSNDKHESHVAHGYLADSLPEKQQIDADQIGQLLDARGVNASGHHDQLQRGYGFLSICGLALNVDVAWIALGSSLVTAISNGGPPGVLYELLVACFVYCFIGASIAELASAVPSAGGVYSWASVTPGPRAGRVIGYFAGLINFFGWLFDLASIVWVQASLLVQMYGLYHPDYVIQQWHIFVALVGCTWLCIAATIFCNRALPYVQSFGMFMVLVGGLVAIMVVAIMPAQHAERSFVWTDFQNETGWPNGVAFLTGVLNGAFTIGTVDAVAHMSEELPNPRKDVPKAVAAQLGLGTVYAFCFAVAIFYGISDLNAVIQNGGSFPLAEIFKQATNSTGATFGLMFIIFLCLSATLIATFLTVGRTFWALARDNAVPFPRFFGSVNTRLSCPIPATILTGVLTTAFGAIAVGSKTAFSDIVGSFVILTTVSYLLAIAPHLLSGRKNVPRGWFWMGNAGYFVNAVACVLILFFDVMFCFPYALPAEAATMNYNSVILVGVVLVVAALWVGYGMWNYERPKVAYIYDDKSIAEQRRLSAV